MEKKIDLHIHSSNSDGTLSPHEILKLAEHLNLSVISITDHDSIDGIKELMQSKTSSPVKLLAGVEISTSPPDFLAKSGSLHILGYAIKTDHTALSKVLDKLQKARKERNPKIIKKLNQIGIDLSMDEVCQNSGSGQLGRPHIAALMIKKGFTNSINDAFDKYLANGRPAYIEKYKVDCKKAISTIHCAGGVSVLAHPGLLKITDQTLFEKLIQHLKDMGLMGIEAYYSEHNKQQTAYYIGVAERYNLIITGGSDFHGSLKPDIKMGTGRGDLSIPYSVYEHIIKKKQSL